MAERLDDRMGLSRRLVRITAVAFLAAPASITAAAAQAPPQCSGAQKPWVVAELLFGRTRVGEASFARFLTAEVTPRFPDGLTVFDTKGQWRPPGGNTVIRERSTVVMIAMPPNPDNDARLQQIVDVYKARFKQQSVGIIVRSACVSF